MLKIKYLLQDRFGIEIKFFPPATSIHLYSSLWIYSLLGLPFKPSYNLPTPIPFERDTLFPRVWAKVLGSKVIIPDWVIN